MTTRATGKRKWSPRSVELAKIHVAATDRNLILPFDDSAYRDMLWSVARVRSAKDLDAGGRQRVLEHLRSLGWHDPSPPRRRVQPSGRAARPQVEKIRALWAVLGAAGHLHQPDESGLRAYVHNQSKTYHPDRVGYDAPELLPKVAASRVIEHLKQWCRRTGTALPE